MLLFKARRYEIGTSESATPIFFLLHLLKGVMPTKQSSCRTTYDPQAAAAHGFLFDVGGQ